MLKITKSITLKGTSSINGVIAENYQAVIDNENPINMNISSWQQDKALYKANRTECRKDSADFEDYAYALQDEMIETNSETETITEQ